MRKQKGVQLQDTGGSAPWTPAGGTAPDPRYRLALRARHGGHTLCSCKLTLKKALFFIINIMATVNGTDSHVHA